MKLGWLWWKYEDDRPVLTIKEPSWGHKWTQIVYCEITT